MKTFFTLFALLSFMYVANAQFSITYETINATCYGFCNGKIKITGATGGTTPYTLTIPENSQSITNYNGTDIVYFDNLCAGNYTVEITDAYQNTAAYQYNIIISQPNPMTDSVTTTLTTCPNACNGSAQIFVSGGTSPYQIILNDQHYNNGIFSDLCAGYYYPYILDANGCELYSDFQISEPSPIVINYTVALPSSCTQTDGSITANVTQGTPPYTYLWSNYATTSTISNIEVGIYHLTVTDDNGCSKISHYALNALNSYLTLNGNELTCYGYSNGKIYISSMILSINYPAYVTWSNDSTNLLLDTLVDINTIPDTLTNIPAGNYFLTITDGTCSNYAYYELTQPDSIKIEADIYNITCYGLNDGYIFLNVLGGTGNYSYNWSNNTTNSFLNNLSANNYTVNVTDENGCTNQSTFTISQPDSFTVNVTPVNISCYGYNDGYLLVIPNGGTPPYYYTLDSANSYNYSSLNDDTVRVYNPGSYNIFIKDANHCDTLEFYDLTISEPNSLQISNVTVTPPTCLNNDGSIAVSASEGTAPFSYFWNNDSTTNTISNLSEGTYSLTIYDANSCQTDTLLTLSMSSQPPVIRGYVLFNQNTVDSSKVLLFVSGQFGAAQWDTVAYNLGANFYFDSLKPGQYILKALYLGQNLNALNTYYNEAFYWTDADTINVYCNDTSYQNINLLQLPPSTGICSMSGYVRFVGNKNGKAASEPVPGAEITVEQVPGPTIIKMALTDTTGYYEANNLPDLSNCNLRVDIPGLPLLSTYTGLSVSSSDVATLTNLNFIVDTTINGGIMKDSTTWIHSNNNNIQSIVINPNPFTSIATVEINLSESENISYKIIDIAGKTIVSIPAKHMNQGNNYIQINHSQIPQSGVYYFVARSPQTTYIKKFIKQ